VSLGFLAVAVACTFVADLEIIALDPWAELGRLLEGLLAPDFTATERLGAAVVQTLAFAFLGVAVGAVGGFGLALIFHRRSVRVACAFLRSIHELFWALIFLQAFGLTAATGVLAIAVPYAAICAKVFSEILDEADPSALKAVPTGSSSVSTFFFARLPDAWPHIRTYTLYRLECGLRSSAILGFVGLPTLGFHLETAFSQGRYSEVWALLILFYLIIATIRLWVRTPLVPAYLLAAPFLLPWGSEMGLGNMVRFFTSDIVPYPLKAAEGFDLATLAALGDWFWDLAVNQIAPGLYNTIILTQIALVGTGILALVFFPLVSGKFFGRFGRGAGHVFLVVARSTPEYMLAFMLLHLWGPSMLPAAVAIALHNGAIIGHLIGRHSDALDLRPDSSRGVNLYAYEVVPRVYGQFLAFLFYRWEIIMRESAILGLLGIHTLGFFVDSAIHNLQLDRAFLLIIVTGLVNMMIDVLSRAIRGRLQLRTRPDAE